MAETSGGEQGPQKEISRDGVGIRAVRILGQEIEGNDLAIRSDFFIKGLRTSNIFDDRQASGRRFILSDFATGVPAASDLIIAGKFPVDTFGCVWFDGSGAGRMRVRVYEGSEFTGGTAKVGLNMNRIFRSTPPKLSLVENPTVTSFGNLLFERVFESSFFLNRPFETRLGDLVVLPDTNYTLRVTNLSATANDLLATLNWWEADFKDLPESTVKLIEQELSP